MFVWPPPNLIRPPRLSVWSFRVVWNVLQVSNSAQSVCPFYQISKPSISVIYHRKQTLNQATRLEAISACLTASEIYDRVISRDLAAYFLFNLFQLFVQVTYFVCMNRSRVIVIKVGNRVQQTKLKFSYQNFSN